jgi:hypothetical protein
MGPLEALVPASIADVWVSLWFSFCWGWNELD